MTIMGVWLAVITLIGRVVGKAALLGILGLETV